MKRRLTGTRSRTERPRESEIVKSGTILGRPVRPRAALREMARMSVSSPDIAVCTFRIFSTEHRTVGDIPQLPRQHGPRARPGWVAYRLCYVRMYVRRSRSRIPGPAIHLTRSHDDPTAVRSRDATDKDLFADRMLQRSFPSAAFTHLEISALLTLLRAHVVEVHHVEASRSIECRHEGDGLLPAAA